MPLPEPDNPFANPDAETVSDFFADFDEAYRASEILLLRLEHSPSDQSLLNDLFRRVHTIKGNLIYIGLADLTPLLQAVEDVLEPLRKGQLQYDDLLSDLILTAMDFTHQWVRARLEYGPDPMAADHIHALCASISELAHAPPADRNQRIADLLPKLDPRANRADSADLKQFNVHLHDDLNFMEALLTAVDQRSPYWQGRTRRIAKLALAMNRRAGEIVDPTQLLAAVYMHDFAMAFLPLTVLHKPGPYSALERGQLEQHTHASASLLTSMGHWTDAARIVREHHERIDGQGYPQGLKGDAICEGAKILAVVDTFDACINSRAHVNLPQRPLIRAVLEINRHAGSQFCGQWVAVFNGVVRPRNRTTANL